MTAPRSVRKSRPRHRPTVELMERRELLAVLMVTNNGDSGNGTLRQAITDANADPGSDQIFFQLAPTQLIISPVSVLPTLSDPGTTIDAGHNPDGSVAPNPVVTIDGTQAGSGVNGLTITGGNAFIRGLAISNFGGTGISISGGGRNVVQDCYIGTTLTGGVAAPNSGDGIDIGSANNSIGGSGLHQGNLISGNGARGILVNGGTATGNVIQGNIIGLAVDGATPLGNKSTGIITNGASGTQIGGGVKGAGNVVSANIGGIVVQGVGPTSTTVQGNYIGTDKTGTIAIANSAGDGIVVNGGGNNLIGGSPATRNVISGGTFAGILLQGATASNNLVKSNYIGVAANGTSPLGNGSEGIIVNGAMNAVIGGVNAADGNVIAYNGSQFKNYGINVFSGTSIEILSNSIYSNVGGGINISKGSNNDQAAPVITMAQTGANQVNLVGRLVSVPNATFTIQFFSNPMLDANGTAEGQTYLGSIQVTADPTGLATFNTRLAGNVAVGQYVTATATQAVTQNTSPFSAPVQLTQAPITNLQVSIAASPSNNLLLGAQETYTITVTNAGPDPATGVQLTNTLDANSNYVSSSTSVGTITQSGPVVTASIGSLAANQSAQVTIVVTAANTGTIQINSIAAGNGIDTNQNPSASKTITVLPAADLGVTLSADPNPVAVNGQLTYVVTVTNNGPSVAHNVLVSDTVPSSFAVGSYDSPDGLTNNPNPNVYTLSVDTLPVNASATLTIVGVPTQVGTITDTANAMATEGDPVPGNNSAMIPVTVAKAADLTITGSASPSPATIGQPLTYSFVISNAGPFAATGAVFTDTLPVNAAYNGATVNGAPVVGTVNNGVLTITLPTIPSGGSATVALTFTPGASELVNDSASVSNTVELDPNANNNMIVVPPVYVSPADIAVSLTASSNPEFIGTPFNYVLIVSNNGPATATSIVATETLATSLQVGQIQAPAGTNVSLNNGLLVATISSLAPGASATIVIPVTPTASGPITSTALVDPNTTTNIDQVPGNNSSTVSTVVSPDDLSVAIRPTSNSPLVGNPLTYSIIVGNGGPAPSTGTVVTGTIPAGVRLVSYDAGPGGSITFAGTGFTANLGTIAVNTYRVITINVVPTSPGTLVTTATAQPSIEYDVNQANNTATNQITAINLPGVFGFASPVYSVGENGGAITLTITRTNGSQGQVAVAYSTSDGTAKAGVNYAYSAGTVIFNDGDTSKTITIPVVDDGAITKNLSFNVALVAIAGGGTLNPLAASTTVTVVNTDVDLVSPKVIDIVPITDGRTINAIVVGFSKSLDPTLAGLASNYAIFTSARDGGKNGNKPVAVLQVIYNDVNHTVTLIPARPLPAGQFYGVAVNGNTSTAITDIYGNVLDGDFNGTAGGNFGAYVGVGSNLSYVDGNNNLVNFKISRGGSLSLTRYVNGDGNHLAVINPIPGRSKLTGSVRKPRVGGTGLTTLSSITGLGAFGRVYSTLSTPPFILAQSGSTPSTTGIAAQMTAASLPRGPVVASRKGR